jgi:uroporphyrinogen-III synthase
MSFDGLRILSLESRRAVEIAKLIVNQEGVAFVAPSVREIALEENQQALAFGETLMNGGFDMVILLTGVGTRLLGQILETRWPVQQIRDALSKTIVVARGPKPAAVLREWQVPIALTVPEPNTWREILATLDQYPLQKKCRIAIQEYGRPSAELLRGLEDRRALVLQVPVYQWAFPEDTAPLEAAARKLAAGDFDAVLFTSSIQIEHLLIVAKRLGFENEVRSALKRAMVCSIGPTMTETLSELGLPPDFEPSHPKMGFLINEAAQRAHAILKFKKGAKP